jgi:hypothetical protein
VEVVRFRVKRKMDKNPDSSDLVTVADSTAPFLRSGCGRTRCFRSGAPKFLWKSAVGMLLKTRA